jgi:hypothetical protein
MVRRRRKRKKQTFEPQERRRRKPLVQDQSSPDDNQLVATLGAWGSVPSERGLSEQKSCPQSGMQQDSKIARALLWW